MQINLNAPAEFQILRVLKIKKQFANRKYKILIG